MSQQFSISLPNRSALNNALFSVLSAITFHPDCQIYIKSSDWIDSRELIKIFGFVPNFVVGDNGENIDNLLFLDKDTKVHHWLDNDRTHDGEIRSNRKILAQLKIGTQEQKNIYEFIRATLSLSTRTSYPKIPISIVSVVHNEAIRLKQHLPQLVELFDEIIIVVQESTDNSLEIINEIGAPHIKVLHDKCHGFCEPSRPIAIQSATNRWILYLDGDEYPTPELIWWLRNPTTPELLRGLGGVWLKYRHLITDEGIVLSDSSEHRFRLFSQGKVDIGTDIHTSIMPKADAKTLTLDWFAVNHIKSFYEYEMDDNRYAILARKD